MWGTMEKYLKMSSELKHYVCDDGTGIIYHSKSNREIRLGETEYKFLLKLNGINSISTILQGFENLDEEHAWKLVKIFCEKGLIQGYEKKRKINLLKMTFFEIKSKDYKRNKSFYIYKFLLDFFIYSAVPVAFIATRLFIKYSNIENLVKNISELGICNNAILFFIITSVSLTLHELFHSWTARFEGAYVPQYNLGITFCFPCISTVVCGLEKISVRGQIKIIISGIAINFWLYFIGVIGMLFVGNPLRRIFVIMLGLNAMLAMFNLVIFVKTDGLHMFSILIGDKLIRQFSVLKINKYICQKKYVEIYFFAVHIVLLICLCICIQNM